MSYVLNNGPRPVASGTRQRVEDAIRELGYQPDARARSLRLGPTHALGLILPDASNPFFAELAHAVERASARHGYALLICNTSDSPADEERYLDDLARRRVDGVLLVSASTEHDFSPWARTSTPVVAMDRLPDERNVSTIRFDHYRGAATATRHLLGHGARRVALVTGPGTLAVSEARTLGWERAAARHSALGARVEAPFTYAGGYQAAVTLLTDTAERPDAILASSDVQAIGVIRAAAEAGIDVPRALSVASIDGTAAAAFANPVLTTVRQPTGRMAAAAVKHLISGSGIVHHTFTGRLVKGRSCGCP